MKLSLRHPDLNLRPLLIALQSRSWPLEGANAPSSLHHLCSPFAFQSGHSVPSGEPRAGLGTLRRAQSFVARIPDRARQIDLPLSSCVFPLDWSPRVWKGLPGAPSVGPAPSLFLHPGALHPHSQTLLLHSPSLSSCLPAHPLVLTHFSVAV